MTTDDNRAELSRRLDAVTRIDPGAPALVFEGQWWTWAELRDIGRRLVAAVGDAEPVGLIARSHPHVVGALIELLIRETPIWILNPLMPDAELAGEVLKAPGGVVAATASDWARPAVADAGTAIGRAVELPSGELLPGAESSGDRRGEADALPEGTAVVLQTSGTTGAPKRIPLGREQLWNSLWGVASRASSAEEVRLRGGVVPVQLPLAHIGGLFGVLFPFVSGRRVALFERFDPHAWAQVIREHRVLTSGLVPAAMRMVLDAGIPPEDLATLRSVRAGTAPLDPALQTEFEERYGVPVITAYGATEFGGGVASVSLEDIERFGSSKRGTVGRAHPGVTLRILDEEGVEQAPGTMGRLHVRQGDGPWVRTNDLAYLDEDGFLFISGRTDNVINRGGFKVSLSEVEKELRELEGVRDAAAIALPDPRLGEVPVAAVVPRDGVRLDGEALRQELRSRVVPYKVPARVLILDKLPLNVSMKIDRNALRELFQEG
jgi:long-chain acyl-CoA synthetase